MSPEEQKALRAQHIPTYTDTYAAQYNFRRGIQSADVCACGVVFPCQVVMLLDALEAVEAERDALLEMFGLGGVQS